MVSVKLALAILVAFSAVVSSKDVIDQLVVATSDCYQCGMTFFGTISIKVRIYLAVNTERCVIWPVSRCCVHPKAGWTTFLPFSTFLLILHVFCWFSSENKLVLSYVRTSVPYTSQLVVSIGCFAAFYGVWWKAP